MPILIVEGVDGSGKTTLIRNLRKQSNTYFWVASSSRRPQTLPDLQDAMHWIGQAAFLRLPVICDRFPIISETVYGPILRGTNLLDQLGRRDQSNATNLLSEVDRVIYCRPSKETIQANLAQNPQMEGVQKNLASLLQRYDDVINSLRDDNIYVRQYDYTRNVVSLDNLFFGRV